MAACLGNKNTVGKVAGNRHFIFCLNSTSLYVVTHIHLKTLWPKEKNGYMFYWTENKLLTDQITKYSIKTKFSKLSSTIELRVSSRMGQPFAWN